LVEGPGEVYICGECVELCQSIIDQEKSRRNRSAVGGSPVPTPDVIRGKLDQLVPGQDEAKEALVLAALQRVESPDRGPQTPMLLIGPTRSSKVFLARALAHAVEAPFAEGDAQALVRSGTEPAGPLLDRLLEACDFDVATAQRGVVYLDGIDQRTTQEQFLRLCEGTAKGSRGHPLQFDVTRILFLCGGTFAGLDEVAVQMGCHPEQPITGEMLVRFGVVPELVRCLQAIVRVAPFDEETLVRLVPFVDVDQMASRGTEQVATEERPQQ
jgi:ATP-dependent Clp protease ATP-binding subunit ClpX